MKWYLQAGDHGDIVVSSRIRLARNINGYSFPNKMSDSDKREVTIKVRDAVLNFDIGHDFQYIEMDKISDIKALSMAEHHLISPLFAENTGGRALLLYKDESVSIMINEEDHIRIQVLNSGLNLEAAYASAQKIDEIIAKALPVAFDERLGYLTECPTNLGTGMRASLMLHLPALQAAGAMNNIGATVGKIGLTLRGAYGEGSRAVGDMFQLSNQVTLGISEETAISNLMSITDQILERERTARNHFPEPERIADAIYRAYGVLKYARYMGGEEFNDIISKIRLGVSMEIINEITLEKINELIALTGQATLQENSGATLEPDARDRLRASVIRNKLV